MKVPSCIPRKILVYYWQVIFFVENQNFHKLITSIAFFFVFPANPSVRNDDGYTALDLARKRGRFIIVRTIEVPSLMQNFSGFKIF